MNVWAIPFLTCARRGQAVPLMLLVGSLFVSFPVENRGVSLDATWPLRGSWLVDLLVGCVVGLLVCVLGGLLDGWLVSCLAGWLLGCLVGWLVGAARGRAIFG